jgi:aminoglycoside 3-N-acetyltransferase
MSLEKVIAGTAAPATTASLTGDLQRLGVRSGQVLIVHSSLSRLGYVAGGAVAVIEALTSALGPAGTLVMPAHSSDLSDPADWRAPAVPEAWHQAIRDAMPAYDPRVTATWSMGAIAESFRAHPRVRRSAHPRQSFAARGPAADAIVRDHPLDCAMGERSPLGRLYDLGASILLLGAGHDSNTSLHLAEHRAGFSSKRSRAYGSPVTIDGQRRWHVVDDLDFDDSDFARLGADYERETGALTIGRVALAESRLMPTRPLVDYAVGWIERNRR